VHFSLIATLVLVRASNVNFLGRLPSLSFGRFFYGRGAIIELMRTVFLMKAKGHYY
jgi:hypothetical protein